MLTDEKDGKVLSAAITFSGVAFIRTKRFDVIRLLLEIARKDSFSNSVRNKAYYSARLIDFGPPKYDSEDDSTEFETEIIGQEPKLDNFDCDYIDSFFR